MKWIYEQYIFCFSNLPVNFCSDKFHSLRILSKNDAASLSFPLCTAMIIE